MWIAAAAYKSGATLITTDADFDHITSAFISVDKNARKKSLAKKKNTKAK